MSAVELVAVDPALALGLAAAVAAIAGVGVLAGVLLGISHERSRR